MNADIEVLRFWIRVVGIIAMLGSISFPVIYAFSPWKKTPLGKIMMLLGVTLAFALVMSMAFSFWRPTNILIVFWVNAAMLTAIAISTSSLSWQVWKLNYARKKIVVTFTGRTYDVLKAVAQIWLPALGTLYFTVAQIWGLPAATEVIGTIGALDTFLGILLGISSSNYSKGDEKYAGTIELLPNEEGTSNLHLRSLDPVKLMERQEVVFKVKQG